MERKHWGREVIWSNKVAESLLYLFLNCSSSVKVLCAWFIFMDYVGESLIYCQLSVSLILAYVLLAWGKWMPVPQLLQIAFSGSNFLPQHSQPGKLCLSNDMSLLSLEWFVRRSQRMALNLKAALKKIILFCAIWKVQVPGEAWVVISAPCSPVLFFLSPMSSHAWEVNFAPRVDGKGWLFPAWCFLGIPVPNQLKLSWKYSVSGGKCKDSLHFPKFIWAHSALNIFLRQMSILEHPGLRRSCGMLSFPMAFAINTERCKKYFFYLIPACCNEGRFFPNHPVLTWLVIPDSCQRKGEFQASPHKEQQVK